MRSDATSQIRIISVGSRSILSRPFSLFRYNRSIHLIFTTHTKSQIIPIARDSSFIKLRHFLRNMQQVKGQIGIFAHLTKCYFNQALAKREFKFDLDQFQQTTTALVKSSSTTVRSGLLSQSSSPLPNGNTFQAHLAGQLEHSHEMHSSSISRRSYLHGGNAILTGASTGIGLSTLKRLVELPLDTIIFTSRDLAKGERVRKQLLEQVGSRAIPDVQVWQLDLSDFESVQAFAQRYKSSGLGNLDLLINNAGQLDLSPVAKISKHGFESHLQVNHLSSFLLTKLLLPSLRSGPSSEPARVICVNSSLHTAAHISPSILSGQEHHNAILSYANSKLMQLMCVSELNKVMGQWNSTDKRSVKAMAISPGFVKSEIGMSSQTPLWTQALMMPAKFLFARGADSGAACVFDAMFREDTNGIHAYYDQMEASMPSQLVRNRELRTLVWNFSTQVARRAEVGNYTSKEAREHLQWFEQEFAQVGSKKQVGMNFFDFESSPRLNLSIPRIPERTWLEGRL
jgi:retinol dehydrogenase-12